MPISSDEFESGRFDRRDDDEGSPIETEKDLIVSFLSERHDEAFTEREVVLGVDFSPAFETESGRRRQSLRGAAADGLLDITGTVTASAVLDDVDGALSERVEEGIVDSREVETDDGTTTYYRLAE